MSSSDLLQQEVSLSFVPTGKQTMLGSPLELTVEILNTGSQIIPEKSYLVISGNSAFHKSVTILDSIIPVGEKKIVAVILRPANAGLEYLEENLFFSVFDSERKKISSSQESASLSINMFIGDLIAWKPINCQNFTDLPNFANMLCYGRAGSGKTSFVNTVISALSAEDVSPGKVGGSTNHVTTAYSAYRFSRLSSYDIPIAFWDCWGTEDNCDLKELEYMLEGQVTEGTSMGTQEKPLIHSQESTDRITCVLLFIPQGSVLYDAADIENLANLCSLATKYNRMPIVIVSKIDEEPDEQVRAQMVQKIHGATALPINRIFLFSQYPSGSTKNAQKHFEVDKLAYRIVLNCLKFTDYYLRAEIERRSLSPQKIHVFGGETGVGPGVGAGVKAGIGPGVGAGIGTGVGAGIEPGIGTGVGAGIGPGVGAGIGPGVGAGIGTGVGPGVGSGIRTGVGAGIGAGLGLFGLRCPNLG
eukprot:TRINITY_DN1434_c0_g2_i29.p1 TRINITY_DN1434_c0_g2~~TRINITY_DN1434_c0_g2_i29.p1  ORF type:complete len:472 (-),score=77.34 TRINITY_DN1434_c0_g2_i29:274-1689(-)